MSGRALRDFYRGLAALLRAGVVCGEALETLRANRTLRDPPGADLRREVQAGSTLAAACAKHPGHFPATDLAIVEAGEAAGRLEEVLDQLGRLYERRLEARRRLVQDSTYPLLLIHLAALMLPFAYLSAQGRMDFDASFRITLFILVPLYLLAAVLFRMNRAVAWRDRLRAVVDALPGFSSAARHQRRGRFATVLQTTYDAGIRLDRGLRLAGRAAGEPRASEAAQVVGDGHPLAEALARTGILAPTTLSRIATGETAGELSATLAAIASEEDEKAAEYFRRSMGAVAKLLYAIVALWIGYVAVQILSRVYGAAGGL